MTTASRDMAPRRPSQAHSALEPLPDKEQQVVDAVSPWVQFNLAQAGGVKNGNFSEANAAALQGLDLDLFRESHAVGGEAHVFQDGAPEYPHAGLRVSHPTEIED